MLTLTEWLVTIVSDASFPRSRLLTRLEMIASGRRLTEGCRTGQLVVEPAMGQRSLHGCKVA